MNAMQKTAAHRTMRMMLSAQRIFPLVIFLPISLSSLITQVTIAKRFTAILFFHYHEDIGSFYYDLRRFPHDCNSAFRYGLDLSRIVAAEILG